MKHKYSVQITWSSADQAFIASVPELPGCAADGGTQEEVIKNLEVIIDEWIETAKELGREVPSPMDVAAAEEATRSSKPRLQPAV